MKERVKRKKKLNYDDEDFLPSYDEQIKEILDNFDFDYVHKIMHMDVRKNSDGEYEPWEVATHLTLDGDYTTSLPTYPYLVNLATMLLQTAAAADNDVYITRSGPFRVIKSFNRLILDFTMHTWSYD